MPDQLSLSRVNVDGSGRLQMRRLWTTVSVFRVKATTSGNYPTARTDVAVRLRVHVHDALAASKGARNVAAQAALHGIHRSTMFRLRSGERVASLELAMRMAAGLDVPVEVLFERTRLAERL